MTLQACYPFNDNGAIGAMRMRAAIAALFACCDPLRWFVSAVSAAVALSATSDNGPGTSNENPSEHSPPDHAGDLGGGARGKQRSAAPPVPDVVVGEQSNPRAGPARSGKRHKSGPLAPQFGGVGDMQKDFDYLTGGTGKPFPASDSRSRIAGAIVGDNGIWMRPGGKRGGRIEIPRTRNKLPETLHY